MGFERDDDSDEENQQHSRNGVSSAFFIPHCNYKMYLIFIIIHQIFLFFIIINFHQ